MKLPDSYSKVLFLKYAVEFSLNYYNIRCCAVQNRTDNPEDLTTFDSHLVAALGIQWLTRFLFVLCLNLDQVLLYLTLGVTSLKFMLHDLMPSYVLHE